MSISDTCQEPEEIIVDAKGKAQLLDARRHLFVDLVLDRGKENRSQFVFTRMEGGRKGR